MFKKITLLFFVAVASFNVQAQFTIDEDTLYAEHFAGEDASDFIDISAHTVIRSTNSMAETITWNRYTNNLPDTNWQSAVCDIVSCRAPIVSIDSFTFANGGDTGILSFHFYVKNISGSGTMIVRFARANNPLEYTDIVIKARAWKPTNINQVIKSQTLVYPIPANDVLSIQNNTISSGKIKVLDALGQLILEQDFSSTLKLNIQGLNAGVYSIIVTGNNSTSSVKFVKS
jgi:hypothetical protein